MRRMLSLMVAAGILAFTGNPVQAQGTPPDAPPGQTTVTADDHARFETWDTNRDRRLGQSEIANARFYTRWNTDHMSGLTRSEFGKGYRDFGFFDEWAADGRVMRDNFGFADERWFGTWDRNRDRELSRLEFMQGAFSEWDRNNDGLIDERELNRGLLSAWDRDRSGTLDDREFSEASPWLEPHERHIR